MTTPRDLDGEVLVAESEFAKVSVWVDVTANGPRLAVRDVKTGAVAYFDALELESLVYTDHDQLAPLLDPGATRWPGPIS